MSRDWTETWERAVVAVLEANPERVLKYSQAAAALLQARSAVERPVSGGGDRSA